MNVEEEELVSIYVSNPINLSSFALMEAAKIPRDIPESEFRRRREQALQVRSLLRKSCMYFFTNLLSHLQGTLNDTIDRAGDRRYISNLLESISWLSSFLVAAAFLLVLALTKHLLWSD